VVVLCHLVGESEVHGGGISKLSNPPMLLLRNAPSPLQIAKSHAYSLLRLHCLPDKLDVSTRVTGNYFNNVPGALRPHSLFSTLHPVA
jgi:hypothetical protein